MCCVYQALACAHEKKRVSTTAVLSWQKWMNYAAGEARLKTKTQRALNWYNLRYLKGRVFRSWKEWVRSEIRSNRKERILQKVQVARDEIESHFQCKLAVLEEENSSLKSQLEDEAKARDMMEEDMKQAFMRGVCALNLEALTVMKRGVPPGKNPFPQVFLSESEPTAKCLSRSNEEPVSAILDEDSKPSS